MEQFLLDQSQLLMRQKKFTLVQVRGNTWCCSEDLIMTLKGRVSPKYSSSLSLLTYFPFSFIYSWSIILLDLGSKLNTKTWRVDNLSPLVKNHYCSNVSTTPIPAMLTS